jgi:hypothetical protein
MDDCPYPFTPVPTAARHDGWTVDRQRGFILHLAEGGVVAAAAKACGMSAKSAYALRKRADAASFAAAWDAALEEGRMRAFDHAIEIARHGEVVPVFYRGRQVGTRRRANNRLAFAVAYGVPMAAAGTARPR